MYIYTRSFRHTASRAAFQRSSQNFGGGMTFRNIALRRPASSSHRPHKALQRPHPYDALSCPSFWGPSMPPDLTPYPRHLSEAVVRVQTREPPAKLAQRQAAPACRQNEIAGHLAAPSYPNCPPGERCRRHRPSDAIVLQVLLAIAEASPRAQADPAMQNLSPEWSTAPLK